MTHQRAHLITGGFPAGASAGHDHDYARLRLLTLLAEQNVQASVANDYADIGKWLPVSRLLITYVAGPHPDAAQCAAISAWLGAGGHWLGLHGTSGGRAERVEGHRQRRTVKTVHHALLGGFFLTHPPFCRFRVDVADPSHPITQGLGAGFEVADEPYFVELQAPETARILLTASYGPDVVSDSVAALYGADTSLQADGKTRVLGYTTKIGAGAVTYFALGHCHTPATSAATTTERGPWENPAFSTLLGNAIRVGMGG